MAADHKHHIQQLADRVTDWLREQRAEFEGQGVNEDNLASFLWV